MDEVDERALRQAREQLADDAHVAALLAAGDPAAERAALALAINAGSSAQGRRCAEEWAWCFLSGFHLRDLSINKRPSGRFFWTPPRARIKRAVHRVATCPPIVLRSQGWSASLSRWTSTGLNSWQRPTIRNTCLPSISPFPSPVDPAFACSQSV